MDGAERVEAGHSRELQALADDSLPDDRHIGVQDETENRRPIIRAGVLSRTDAPDHHRIDGLKMRRMRRDCYPKLAGADFELAVEPQVVRDIANAGRIGQKGVHAIKFGEKLDQRLAENIGYEIQTAAMHPGNDHFVDARPAGGESRRSTSATTPPRPPPRIASWSGVFGS